MTRSPRLRPRSLTLFFGLALLWPAAPADAAPAPAAAPVPVAVPDEPDAAFAAANAAFYAGDYQAARAAYEALVASDGLADAALWHNLGNARFRLGAYGGAIHAYRSGLLLEPADAPLVDALRRNLETARRVLQSRYRATGDAGFVYAEPGGITWQLGHMLGVQTIAITFGACWLAFMGLLIARRVRPASARAAGRLALVAGVAVVLSGTLLVLRLSTDADHQLAVVAASEAQLRDGPHPTAQGKPLPEGLEVRMVGETEGWSQVELVGGRRGWVEDAALLRLGAPSPRP